jgi:hypothetical protein
MDLGVDDNQVRTGLVGMTGSEDLNVPFLLVLSLVVGSYLDNILAACVPCREPEEGTRLETLAPDYGDTEEEAQYVDHWTEYHGVLDMDG